MSTDIGMINDFIQKEEEVKEELFSGTKHHCIFEINKETKKHKFVDDYGEDYTAADEMCQSMNNFKPKDKFVHFILRCLEQEEFDTVQDFLKTNPHGDVSEVYSPFTQKIVVTKTMED